MPLTSQIAERRGQDDDPAEPRPGGDRARAGYPPRSTSESRRAISEASGEPGAMPTPAAASLTSRRTSSATVAPPATRSNAAACSSATRASVVLALGERRAAVPSPPARPARSASSRSAAVSSSTSRSPTWTLSATLVGQLREPAGVRDHERLAERQRTDRRARGLAHRRRAEIDVDVARRHQPPEPPLVDVALPHDSLAVEPEPLQPPVEVEARRRRAHEQEPRARPLARSRANASSSCGTRLLALMFPKAPIEGVPAPSGGRDVRHRPGRMRDVEHRTVEARRACPVGDVARMRDHSGGEREHLARERKVLRARLPERREALVEHAVAE